MNEKIKFFAKGEEKARLPLPIAANKRILVVNQQEYLGDAISLGLSRHGYDCIQLDQPSELAILQAKREYCPHLALFTGTEFRKSGEAREGLTWAAKVGGGQLRLPILIMTGHEDEPTLKRIRDMRAEYIAKPANMDDILSKIEAMLSKRNASQFHHDSSPRPLGRLGFAGSHADMREVQCSEI